MATRRNVKASYVNTLEDKLITQVIDIHIINNGYGNKWIMEINPDKLFA